MYKKIQTLQSYLNVNTFEDELFSRSSMNVIIRALLEPVANQNASSIMFSRFKNTDGLQSLIKRLEYCTNVDMIDVCAPGVLIKDSYVELEFIIFTSPRYNFTLLWDYSRDKEKNYTKAFFLTNSGAVNEVFEVLQNNMQKDFRSKFYAHKPERRENKLLNEALFNVFKKLNNSIEENLYKSSNDYVVDLSQENFLPDNISQIGHEIKNQLSIIDVYSTLLQKQTGSNKNIDMIKKAVFAVYMELNELKNCEDTQINEIVLQDIIENCKNIFDDILLLNNNKINLKTNYDYDINVFADKNKLMSAFGNILKNANEASKNDEIIIELKLEENFVLIDFTNHGKAIDKNIQAHIFENGYTNKTGGSGTGLYSARKNLEKFKGKIELLNSNASYTTFRVTLPLI